MTNQMIIFLQAQKLAEAGKIKYTGRTFKGVNLLGEEVEFKETEAIHTFATWKSLGFIVKKGQKAVASFPVWKYVIRELPVEEPEDPDVVPGKPKTSEKMIMKVAAFFTREQVEELAK